MSLKTTWSHDDTTNRVITEPLSVSYTTDELYYEIAPKGTGTKPAAVTTAEDNLDEAVDDLSDAREALATIETNLSTAKTALDTAYSTWYGTQTLSNFQAYATACNTYNSVKRQYKLQQSTINSKAKAVQVAQDELDEANEDWAVLSETVEYKGGRFLGYEHHRIARMRMNYIGFTLEAATACKAYFDTLYTRTFSRSATFNNGVIEILTQTANTSSVKLVKAEGDNYTVEIEVEEDDVKLSTESVNPSTLFTTENARVYI